MNPVFPITFWVSYCEEKTSGWLITHFLYRFMNQIELSYINLARPIPFMRALNVYIIIIQNRGSMLLHTEQWQVFIKVHLHKIKWTNETTSC